MGAAFEATPAQPSSKRGRVDRPPLVLAHPPTHLSHSLAVLCLLPAAVEMRTEIAGEAVAAWRTLADMEEVEAKAELAAKKAAAAKLA